MSDRAKWWLGCAAVIALGCLPLWTWFRGDWFLKTSDIRLPPSWAEWPQFWFAWNDQVGTGTAPLFDHALLLYNALTAFASRHWFDVSLCQKLLVAAWLPLAGLGMYRLVTRRVQGAARVPAGLVAASYYLFNLWQETIWIGFKPPQIVGYAAMPFVLDLTLDALDRRSFPWPQVLGITLWSVPAAAMWNNPTEAVPLVAPAGFAWLVTMIHDRRDPARLRRHAAFLAVTIGCWAAVNVWWWGPQAAGILRQWAGPDFQRLRHDVALSWLEGISTHTSLPNVLRLQGDWTWYDGMIDPYRPHAEVFRRSIGLQLLSWLTPLVALYALIRSRSRLAALAGALILLGAIFSAGTHPPTRPLYLWLFDHVPGFWTLRSPYFKFGYWIVVGFAVLSGLAVAQWAARHPDRWRRAGVLAVGMLIAGQLAYAYPMVTGAMFTSAEERTALPPDRIRLPAHVRQAADWVEGRVPRGRILTVPGDNVWINTWGYVGYGSSLQTFTTVPIVFDYAPEYLAIAVMAPHASHELTHAVMQAIIGRATDRLDRLLRMLGVRYILQENDVRHDFYKGAPFVEHDSPEFMQAVFAAQAGIAPAASFGPWDLYEVPDGAMRTTWAEQVAVVQGPVALAVPLAGTAVLEQPAVLFTRQQRSPELIPRLVDAGAVGAIVTDGTLLEPAPLRALAAKPALPLWMILPLAGAGQETRQSGRLHVPRAGLWRCQAFVYNTRTSGTARNASITLTVGDITVYELIDAPTVRLAEGPVEWNVRWGGGDVGAIVFSLEGESVWAPRVAPLDETRIDPTQSTIAAVPARAGMLTFHQSAHPGWDVQCAAGDGVRVTMNGYAQGWWLPAGSAGPCRVVFEPQRIVQSTAGWSIAALGFALIAALVGWRRSRRSPTG